jgi:hypothetical protein
VYADSIGITKIDPVTKNEIDTRIASLNSQTRTFFDIEHEDCDIYVLIENSRDLIQKKFSNQFTQKYFAILNKHPSELNDLDSAIVDYVYHPVNSDGFYSLPFKQHHNDKKRVLLIGDSFTYGMSLNNKTYSFANILLAKGYTVYNAGISGADPPQYLAIAKKYIPILKPDFVIVNFYQGNDIEYYHRSLKPHTPIQIKTNAGYLFMCPSGVYFNTPEEAFRFALVESSIPATTPFNKICSHSAIGTVLWKTLYESKLVKNIHPEHISCYVKEYSLSTETPPCIAEIESIKKIATANKSQLLVSVIPDLTHKEPNISYLLSQMFPHVHYYLSPLTEAETIKNDGHFNEAGHFRYANFLDSLMRL